jgi:hypothetical protein
MTQLCGTIIEESMPTTSVPIATNPITANLLEEGWSYWTDACQRAM